MERQRSFKRLGTSWCLLFAVLAVPSCTLPAQSAQPNQALSASEVSQRLTEANARRRAALQQYESRRSMTVTYDGPLGQGEAVEMVQMVFTAPATKQFTVLSATGATLIRDNVFQRALDAEKTAATEQAQQASALNTENYNLRLIGVEQLPAGRCYVLDVSPKVPGEFTYIGRVWVQAVDFAVVRIQGRPSMNPSPLVSEGQFTTDFQKTDGFYFPRTTVSRSQLPLGMQARLTIQYGPYRILSAHSR